MKMPFSTALAARLFGSLALLVMFAGEAWSHPDLDVHPRSIENFLRQRVFRDTMWVDNEAGDEELVWELDIQPDSIDWITAEPMSGRLGPGQGQICVVTQDGRGLGDGHFYALLHYTSNDPTRDAYDIPVAEHTIAYPQIAATWRNPEEGEWWGLDMDRIVGRMEWGSTYGFDLNIVNRGSARLDCDTILCNNAYFTFAPGIFSLDPGANRAVRVTFNAREVGGNAGTINSVSNAWDPRELNFRITATVDSTFRKLGSLRDVEIAEDAAEVAIADLDTVFVSSSAGTRIDVTAGYGVLYRIARNGELLVHGRPNWNGVVELIATASAGDSTLADTCLVTVRAVADPPNPFDLILPEDADTLYFDGGDSLLVWQSTTDPDGDTVSYALHLYNSVGLDTTILGLTDTTFSIRELYYREDVAGEFHWTVNAMGGGEGRAAWSTFTFYLTDGRQIVDESPLPNGWRLLQAYPNPFNGRVVVSLQLPASGRSSVAVYDLHGDRVVSLYDGALRTGAHSFTWDAGDVTSGIYLVRVEYAGVSYSQKLVLVR